MTEKPEMPAAPDKGMPLLITGAAGFVGRNLAATLRALGYTNLLLYDVDSAPEALAEYAGKAAFVFHLAGVNRPRRTEEFYEGNGGFTRQLLEALQKAQNPAPVLLSSSNQAGNGTDYAKSKEEAEAEVWAHGCTMHSPVLLYRLPGVFGKWSRPNYNTVVATFCYNIARGLPIEVRDPAFMLTLCYIDDVVAGFIGKLDAFLAAPSAFLPPVAERPEEEDFLGVYPTYEITLGWLAGTLRSFAKTRQTLAVPDMADACTKKLWATYLSFLPPEEYAYPLVTHADERGSFTEFMRTHERGQVSVNVAKPGVVKGNHWHNTKNEKFLVVSGRGVIRIRPIGEVQVQEFFVSGEELVVVDIPPGSTHNIENVGEGDLVTLMWACEPFDPDAPDTYHEQV